MALTGSMRDFGISEILQLIGHQKKSGTLEVKDKTRRVLVLFDQGAIVSASHDPFVESFDLGAMLSRSGRLSASQVEAALKLSRETLEPIEQILLKANALSLSELKEAVTLSRLEVIYSLFLWRDGDYSFEAGPVNYPHQWTEPISSEQVLMDGYRIKDEWPLLEQVVSSLKLKLNKVETESELEDKLDRDQARLLAAVNGERTVEDLVFLSRMGSFDALKVIKELLDRGRISIADRVEEEVKKDAGVLLIRAAAGVAIAAGLLLIAVGAYQNAVRWFPPGPSGPGPDVREWVFDLHQGDRLRSALMTYAARTGKFPDRVERLAEEGIISNRELKRLDLGFTYQVQNNGLGFRLSARGATGEKSKPTAAPAALDQGG